MSNQTHEEQNHILQSHIIKIQMTLVWFVDIKHLITSFFFTDRKDDFGFFILDEMGYLQKMFFNGGHSSNLKPLP